jgi:glutathione S-transferase
MRLIGMLDSPYVRKVAVTLDQLGLPFAHESISVFRDFARFHGINPLVKAPTLVCDDGTVLMDSALIVQYVESTLPSAQSLWSSDAAERRAEFRAVALAHMACEKAAQLVYEQNLRPKEFQYEPWVKRVTGQLLAAFGELERELARHPALFARERSHAAIMAGIAWQFAQSLLAIVVPAGGHPLLSAHSRRMEATPSFLRFPPDGPGVPVDGVDSRGA